MAVAAGWYFFGDFPDLWTFVGVGILIACAIYISIARNGAQHRADPRFRAALAAQPADADRRATSPLKPGMER